MTQPLIVYSFIHSLILLPLYYVVGDTRLSFQDRY